MTTTTELPTPMLYVRKFILDLTQGEFAEIAKTSQGTISKWEAGELEPDRAQLALISEEIQRRRIKWNDTWFLRLPPDAARVIERATRQPEERAAS